MSAQYWPSGHVKVEPDNRIVLTLGLHSTALVFSELSQLSRQFKVVYNLFNAKLKLQGHWRTPATLPY